MNLSFEFFPPKTTEGLHQLLETAQQLKKFQPEFFSVTYGAGGSTQEFTLNTLKALQELHLTVAPHISCIGATKEKIKALLNHYQQQDISHLIALRGDLPSGEASTAGDFRYATDLVKFIRATHADTFKIFVAAYPESHPQAPNYMEGLKHFKAKVDAGANFAITQYFFNANAYFQFVADCRNVGITIPIIPGIMPIYNFSQLARFSDMCGAEIPRYMRKCLESMGDDVKAIRAFGVKAITHLCKDLLAGGAPGLHFYTLNKHAIASEILEQLNG